MTPTTDIERIARLLSRSRLSLGTESATQDSIENVLKLSDIAYEREKRLSDKDIIDFLVGDVGVEVKIKGQPADIFRQLKRYALHDDVRSILLATNRAMNLPDTILGKPAAVISLGLGWL